MIKDMPEHGRTKMAKSLVDANVVTRKDTQYAIKFIRYFFDCFLIDMLSLPGIETGEMKLL